tara:strand:- start:195 stop:938 length:744 start_codon:yes stop_codon:yes gene_type:complete
MIKDLLKKIIKLFLKRFGWRLEKVIIPKEYRPHPPEKKLVAEIIDSTGILHLGAHRGSEAPIYEYFAKSVVWVEANPKIFESLKENLFTFKKQKSLCALLGDDDGKIVDFNLSSNDSASSSIFEYGELSIGKNTLWPHRKFKMLNKIKLKMRTLDSLLNENNIDASEHNHWIMDLQGAELLAFMGATESIKSCRSIYIEISKGDVYKGGAQWNDIQTFLKKHNFLPAWLPKYDHVDVLFVKENFVSK